MEFAIVSPILIGLLFGTIEFGFVFYSYSQMQSAVRDVTRQVSVNTIGVGDAPDEIRGRLPGWMRGDATIALAETTPGNPATNVFTATASVPAQRATPLRFWTAAGDFDVQTSMEMKQELPYL